MRLFRSLSFRLTLSYVALFALSVLVLTGVYYGVSIKRPTDRVKTSIQREMDRLITIDETRGRAALVAALEDRRTRAADRQAYHALLPANGPALTGNLPSWPRAGAEEWLRIEADIYRDGDEEDHEALVLDRRLADGTRLLIGRDIEDIDDLEEGVKVAWIWLLAVTLLLGIGGGSLMSRAIGRRLEAIRTAAVTVIDGDLSGRVPLRGTGDDFDALSSTLNRMLERIEELMESVRRVSDSVAHELRTPLVRLHADLVDLQRGDEEKRELLLASALAETERLKNVFDAVLRIARIEAGRHAVELRAIDLPAILADAIELYQPVAEEKRIVIENRSAPELTLIGDADLLFQAICNLLDNAVKYTPAGGTILLSAQRRDDGIELVLSDTGPGVPVALREKVFERFYRADGVGDAPGFGLGLALVRGIASLHRSEVRLDDAGPGLKVTWTFKT